MHVLVTYNTPAQLRSADHLCHNGVMDEVRDVTQALADLGYTFETLGIGRDIRKELSQLLYSCADVVFNLCESINEESRLQPSFTGQLELIGIPFTGSGTAALSTAIDKQKTKALLHSAGIWTPDSWQLSELLRVHGTSLGDRRSPALDVSFPLIVKPRHEDGSIGIEQSSVVTTWDELRATVAPAIQRFGADGVIVEKYIEGREFYQGLLGNDDLEALPLSEITFENAPPEHRPIMTYQVKWEPESLEHSWFRRVCPANVTDEQRKHIVRASIEAFRTIGLTGYGRIDIRWETATGRAYVIDVNANPDVTNGQGLPFTAMIAGIKYPELVDRILRYGLEQHRSREADIVTPSA